MDMFGKGQRLDEAVVSAFARGRVAADALAIYGEAVVSGDRILRDLEILWQRHPDLAALHASFGWTPQFERVLKGLTFPPELALFLTVMRSAEAALYEKAVVGAWMAVLMGFDLDLDPSETGILLKGALLRDLGMLYAPRELISPGSKTRLDRAGRAGMEEHVEVGAAIVARAGPHFDKVAALVREHHERIDGSGYPLGLKEHDLSLSSRVVAICDVATAIRMRPNPFEDIEIHDVLSVMKMDRLGLCPTLYDRFSGRLKASLSSLDARKAASRHAAQLGLRCQVLSERVEDLQDRLRPRNRPGVDMASIRARAKRTFELVRRSGLTDREVAWWLKQVASGREESTPEQLKEVELQQNELMRQLDRIDIEFGTFLGFSDVANR